jgi:guanine deaminase
MAHAIYLTNEELSLMRERKSGISHCPISNFALHSGILDVKKVLRAGIKVNIEFKISF